MKKHTHPVHPRAIAMLMAAVALPLTPVLAQEAAPPPLATTAVPPPVAAEPATPPAAATAPVFAAPAPVVQNVPPPGPRTPIVSEEAAPEAAAPARRAPRVATRPQPARVAPVAVAPVAAPEPATPDPVADVAPTTVPAPVAEVTKPSAAPVTTASEPVTTSQTSQTSTTPWLAIGLVALGAILLGLFLMRRRGRAELVLDEPAYVAPTVAREPVAPAYREPIAPVAPAPVAAQQDARPWVGLSFAPIRAGTDGNDTLVEYELTVENSSDVAAHDVRVSSFLINGTQSSANEQSLIRPMGEAQSRTVDILPNGSVPIAATIHVDRGALNGDTFSPKVVAEVRYPLPGGGEGLFSARFALGIADGDGIKAVGLSDGMHNDVGARLDEVLEQA